MIPRGKGVGVANWLVSKTSGILDAKLSRRSFISRATLVGTAVAVAGCREVAFVPTAPYTLVTQCPPGTWCSDGYTEFCCVINGGVNACPPNTIAAGWWRADYSVFCDGTRYYIDCNEVCCGPRRRDGFCASCSPCRCANGCDTRKVYCNYFRYGQCNQGVRNIGPIACRMVTCVPPYTLDIGCSASGAVDNSTANHFSDCGAGEPPPSGGGGGGGGGAPAPPPAPPAAVLSALGGLVVSVPGITSVFARHSNGRIWTAAEQPGSWSGWSDLAAPASSGGSAVLDGSSNPRVYFRLANHSLGELRHDGSAWSMGDLSGTLASDPVAVVFGGVVYVFVRGADAAIWYRSFNGTWSSWAKLAGTITSTPAVTVAGTTLYVFARLSDNTLAYSTLTGGTWSPTAPLGGEVGSDISAVTMGSEVFAFVRWKSDNTLQYQRWNGASWAGFAPLAGELTSDPVAVVRGSELFVFVRWSDNSLRYVRYDGTTWDPWTSLGGSLTSDPAAILDGTLLRVFAGFNDGHLWQIAHDGTTWSAFEDLGGTLALVRGS